MSAHTLSVGLWIQVGTLHSVLATTTALVITYLKHRKRRAMDEGGEGEDGDAYLLEVVAR